MWFYDELPPTTVCSACGKPVEGITLGPGSANYCDIDCFIKGQEEDHDDA